MKPENTGGEEMKTLDEVKEDLAHDHEFKTWREMFLYTDLPGDELINEVANRYAAEVAKEALRRAAKNAKLQVVNIDWRSIEIVDRHSYSVSGGHGEGQNKWAVFVYSDSITDSKNIPTP